MVAVRVKGGQLPAARGQHVAPVHVLAGSHDELSGAASPPEELLESAPPEPEDEDDEPELLPPSAAFLIFRVRRSCRRRFAAFEAPVLGLRVVGARSAVARGASSCCNLLRARRSLPAIASEVQKRHA